MNQILPCDWLPERSRWSYLGRSGLPAVFRNKNVPENHMINPLLTKLFRSKMAGYYRGKFLKKLWCCVGGKYNEIIGFYQLG